jgi:hypothetical protein
MEQRRKTVQFSPGKIDDVQEWEKIMKSNMDDTPLGKYLKTQNKVREKRRQLIEKVSFVTLFLVLFRKKLIVGCIGRLGLEKTRFWTIDIGMGK